jgi:hypothetical protein
VSDVGGDDAASRTRLYYFAFGANMSSRVLGERRGVTAYSSEPATLLDHRLVFDHLGIPFLEPAFASVVAAAGSVVHGVLYALDARGFAKLDRVEGPGYRLRSLMVEGAERGPVEARVYQTRQPRGSRRPSTRYLRLLCDGAREHGLPDSYIEALEAQPSVHVPGSAAVIGAMIKVGEFMAPLFPRKRRTPER